MIPGRRKCNQPRQPSVVCSPRVGESPRRPFHLHADAPKAQFTTSPPQDGFAVANLGRPRKLSGLKARFTFGAEQRRHLSLRQIFKKCVKKSCTPPRSFAKRALPGSMSRGKKLLSLGFQPALCYVFTTEKH